MGGGGGGGERERHTYKLKILGVPISYFFIGNRMALKHVSMTCMRQNQNWLILTSILLWLTAK